MAVGVTETGVPFMLPGIQAKVVPTILLLTDKEDEVPVQIVEGVAVGVITGFGLTVTVTVSLPVHPLAVPVTV